MVGLRAARSFLAAAVAAIAGASGAGGATIVVETTVDAVTSSDGLCSLREAVQAANGNTAVNECPAGAALVRDTIELPAGHYTLAIAGTGENAAATGDLDVTDTLLVQGAGKGITIIDGGGLDRVFHLNPTKDEIQVTLADLSVRNGAVSGDNGGGIANSGGASGLAILLKVAVLDSASGADDFGGGIFNDGALEAWFSDVSGNTGGDGAGLFAEGGSTTNLFYSRVTGNTSSTSAGGINNNGTLKIFNSLIADNTATLFNGGGILNNVTLEMDDSTLSGNSAGAAGAALHNGDNATLRHVTITDNSTVPGGGAIFNNDTVDLDHTLLAANPGDNCAGTAPTSLGFNLEDGVSCALAGAGDQSGTDPQLGPLQANGGPTETHALAATSPAVDAGDAADSNGFDQRRVLRGVDGDANGSAVRDIGAFELDFAFVVNLFGDGADAIPGDGVCETVVGSGLCSLRAAVQEANARAGFDTIELGAGTYQLAIPGGDEDAAATGDLDINRELLIEGAGAGVTIIDGGNLDRVFHVQPLPGAMPGSVDASLPFWVEIAGLSVRNGFADLGGCVRSAIEGLFCALLLTEMEIAECEATNGGGLYLDEAARVTATDSSFRANQGSNLGGAIYGEFTSRLLLNRSTVEGNTVGGSGGGLEAGFVTLWNSTVSGNVANNGGALFTDNLTTVAHSTIAYNTATSGEAGGLFLVSTVIFDNSILAGNTGDPGSDNCNTGSGTAISRGFNLESSASCGLGTTGDVSDTDPKLVPLADNGGFTRTHLPAASSPAIDTGDDGQCPETDQRAVTRPEDGDGGGGAGCDKGAVEALACQPLVLEGFTIDSPFDYAACESITARDLLFGSNASGRLRAGRLVMLGNGVASAAGAAVEVAIDAALGVLPP